jgi:hypothetical protein
VRFLMSGAMRFHALVITQCLMPLAASATEAAGASKSGGYRFYINYRPAEPKSLDEIPATITVSLVAHLKDRLGDAFFAQLRFVGGQIVDFDELYRISPRYRTRGEEIPKYDLHFEFARPDLGIEHYVAQIKLRADGTVLQEIELPAFRAHPEKRTLLPLAAVTLVAANHGVGAPLWVVGLGYSVETDSIVWRLGHQISGDRRGGKIANVEISAHDGTVIKKFETDFMQ